MIPPAKAHGGEVRPAQGHIVDRQPVFRSHVAHGCRAPQRRVVAVVIPDGLPGINGGGCQGGQGRRPGRRRDVVGPAVAASRRRGTGPRLCPRRCCRRPSARAGRRPTSLWASLIRSWGSLRRGENVGQQVVQASGWGVLCPPSAQSRTHTTGRRSLYARPAFARVPRSPGRRHDRETARPATRSVRRLSRSRNRRRVPGWGFCCGRGIMPVSVNLSGHGFPLPLAAARRVGGLGGSFHRGRLQRPGCAAPGLQRARWRPRVG